MSMAFRIAAAGAVVFGIGMLFTLEYPPMDTVQTGYRGTGGVQVYNPESVAARIPANQFPDDVFPLPADGPLAKDVYQNVQVLGDITETEFLGVMTAITAWVSPDQGCTYCHAEGEELSSDSLYTKVVSRRMIQMTQHINTAWESHVGQTGVNCYTCHRGQNVPSGIWFVDPGRPHARGMAGNPAGQNIAAPQVGLSSLPNDPFSLYLVGEEPGPFALSDQIRMNGDTALPTGNLKSIKQTEYTYGLMVHLSESLGVNCTFCHNTRSFAQWEQSPPQRVTAWHGLRLVRELNNDYLVPLQPVYPPYRLGALGDPPKAYCTTCHKGVYKPLYGAPAVADWPSLDTVYPGTYNPGEGPRRQAAVTPAP